MSDYVKLAVAVLLVCTGWFGRSWYDDSREIAIRNAIDGVNVTIASSIAGIKVENKTVYNKTIEHMNTETLYKECQADQVTMDLTNQAILGK